MKKILVITLALILSGVSYAMDSTDGALKKLKNASSSFANVYRRMAGASEHRLDLKQQILNIENEMLVSGYDKEKKQKILELQNKHLTSKKKTIKFEKRIGEKIQEMVKQSTTTEELNDNMGKLLILIEDYSLKLDHDKKS